jgi:hypothetical protein
MMIWEGCVLSYFELGDWGNPWEILRLNFELELTECGRGLLATCLSCFKTETSFLLKIWFKEKDFASWISCSDFMCYFGATSYIIGYIFQCSFISIVQT